MNFRKSIFIEIILLKIYINCFSVDWILKEISLKSYYGEYYWVLKWEKLKIWKRWLDYGVLFKTWLCEKIKIYVIHNLLRIPQPTK